MNNQTIDEVRDGARESYPFTRKSMTMVQERIAELMGSDVPPTTGSIELLHGYLSLAYSPNGGHKQ